MERFLPTKFEQIEPLFCPKTSNNSRAGRKRRNRKHNRECNNRVIPHSQFHFSLTAHASSEFPKDIEY